MSSEPSPQSEYTMGYSDEFLQLLKRRSVERDCSYLLPHLKPGLDVLDFGCGPGTLSVGLARLVEPGELHGVDIEDSQIAIAQSAARSGGHGNAAFQVADAADLPFEDDSFDVAHCHTVLTHVPDTQAALSEIRRVLKPGGIIASRELITASCFVEPDLGDFEEAWNVFSRLLAGNGGHPNMGRGLKNAFIEAGFTNPRVTSSFETYAEPEDISFLHSFIVGWFFTPEIMQAAITYGLATKNQFDGWRIALDGFREHSGAMGCLAFGECIASNP